MVLLVTLGVIAALIVLQLVLAALMRSRRGWARGLLVVTVLLSVPALLVTQDLVSGRTRLGFLLHSVLMIVAAVMMFLRDGNEWFRNQMKHAGDVWDAAGCADRCVRRERV